MLPVVSYLGPGNGGNSDRFHCCGADLSAFPVWGVSIVQSALNRDYTLLMGTVIVYSTLLVLLNFVVDILYSVLDPRVTYK